MSKLNLDTGFLGDISSFQLHVLLRLFSCLPLTFCQLSNFPNAFRRPISSVESCHKVVLSSLTIPCIFLLIIVRIGIFEWCTMIIGTAYFHYIASEISA